MTKLLPTSNMDEFETAYEKRWGRAAHSIFTGLKAKDCTTVADVANMTSAELLRTNNLGQKGFPRMLILLDENEIQHNLRQGLSAATEARWKRNVESKGAVRNL